MSGVRRLYVVKYPEFILKERHTPNTDIFSGPGSPKLWNYTKLINPALLAIARMHIAYFVDSFPKVSETFIMNQIEAMLAAGHKITIFAHKESDEKIRHRKVDQYNMVDLCQYTNPPTNYPAGVYRTIKSFVRHPNAAVEILRAVRSKRPSRKLANLDTFLSRDIQQFDAYHAHFGPVGEDWTFLHRLSHIDLDESPFIVSFYGTDASEVLEKETNPYSNVFTQSDTITVLSEDMERSLINSGCPSGKIVYNPLGIDTEFFAFETRQPAGESVDLLIISRLVEKKGIRYAIEALNMIEDLNINLTIVGDGPLREDIENQIHELNLEDSVELVGVKPLRDVKEYLYDSQILLMPCITDSDGSTSPTPTILLQAQATGIPIISTYHSGIPRIVEDGESAILVQERDPEAMADVIKKLVESPERWSEMGQRGREFVEEQHSIDALSNRLFELYT